MNPAVNHRPPAVAGLFYPAAPDALRAELGGYFAAARATDDGRVPKALIVPHAGTVYSGPTAARAYACLAPARAVVRRVVLLGPAHRVAVHGLAIPSVEAFAGPLGPVPLDRAGLDRIAALPGVRVNDEAHRLEHCLEVQLPFLQTVLDDFALVPVVVGDADSETVSRVLDSLWGGRETLILISSDLSHFEDYDSARQHDRATAGAIETLVLDRLGGRDACGCRPINGLLRQARARDLRATTIDLCSSGDTAGPRDRVVGYGAWRFDDNAAAGIGEAGREKLLEVAARAIRNGLARGRRPNVAVGTFALEIENVRASFVTLKHGERLRGCIGSMRPHRPLVADVAWNAYSAAFADPRFQALKPDEFADLDLSISVLGIASPIAAADQAALLARLRPGIDGLILQDGERRGTFLPQVWEQIPDPADFLRHLKEKAGLEPDYWSPTLTVSRYSTETFGAPVRALPIWQTSGG